MDAALGAAQWAVCKALAPAADGVLEAWWPSSNLEALKTELMHLKDTLEIASGKQLGSPDMGTLLQKLRDSAHDAEDLLDEVDYFRIQDELQGTFDAAAEHTKGCVHNLALNARRTAKAVGKLICFAGCSCAASLGDTGEEDAIQRASCCAWPRAKQKSRNSFILAPNANQVDEVSGCMRKLGKLLPCSSFSPIHDDDDSGMSTFCGACMRKAPQRKHAEETPKLGFNRVNVSQRMKHIVEQLQPVRREVATILQSCGLTIPDIAQSHHITTHRITTDRSIEATMYGRNHTVGIIIHDITKGKSSLKDLSVLPIVGPGGIGKTTMARHIYNDQEVQNHFHVRIWVCVSLSFNLNKLLEEIKERIPRVEGEKNDRPEELIEQRLKTKRLLLVLDDIWECSIEDDWKRLLLLLKRSQEKGSVILVTTRFQAIAQMVKTTNHSINLEGLESEDFRKLFLAFVFDDEQCRGDHTFLLETGEKIMEKLKGSPLAAKTVGRLLRKNLNLRHWRRVLESKEWEKQTSSNDIMPALKLSYDYLPFYLQQCFSYSALFPEDYRFRSSQLISLWVGLDILQPDARNPTFEDIGLSNLNALVAHGFFKEEETDGCPYYVMHDLLRDLALKFVAHECLSLDRFNVGSVQIQSCIRHLSIVIDYERDGNEVSGENFKSELRKLKTRLKIEHLRTLMVFGEMDESFANIFGDLFREANALRVLHLLEMSYPVESVLHNFSAFVHLRYLCLGTKYKSQMHLPLNICRFYHLRILDLSSWYGSCDLPRDMSNLVKLCCFYTRSGELHSDIYNVGKLKLLEELKVFRVNKQSEGFEPKQLEHLVQLRELGIYNLEKIHTKEEAAEAKLIEKTNLKRLTLDWDSNAKPNVEAVVLDSLQPHRNLQELYIRGHGGRSRPIWLGDELAVEALQSLHLVGVSWEVFPSLEKMQDLCELRLEHIATMKEFVIEQCFCRLTRLTLVCLQSFKKWVPRATHLFPLLQILIIRDCPKLLKLPFSNHIVYPPEQDWNIDWFPNLQELEIENCPKVLLVVHIPWTEILCSVKITNVKLLEQFEYSKSSNGVELGIIGKDDLDSLDQALAFSNLTKLEKLTLEKCPPLELKHLLMLTSLKTLIAKSSKCLVGPLGGLGDMKWQLPVEHIQIRESCGDSGRDLTELLPHFSRLSKLEIIGCGKITELAVRLDPQETTSAASETEEDEVTAAELTLEQEKEEDGVLRFPAHLSGSLRELVIIACPELVLAPDGHNKKTGRGGLQTLQSLQRLEIESSPKFFLSAYSSSCHLFPSSLQDLDLSDVEGMGTLEHLSNLTSLTRLAMYNCREDLRCKGLQPLLTKGGQLRKLIVYDCPRFFAGWDSTPSRVLQDEEKGEAEPQLQLSSSTLLELATDEATGFLAAPICSHLSSSLTRLLLCGSEDMERFSKEQEDALHLLTSLQKLLFLDFDKLQHLPAGLHKLTNLRELSVRWCPAVRSLPKDFIPNSLQALDVSGCGNEELTEQCRELVGTNQQIRLL